MQNCLPLTASSPPQISESDFQALEQFDVCLYNVQFHYQHMRNNLARRIPFAKGGRTIEIIPPTLDALKEHIKRSTFQAIKRSQCLIKNPSSSIGMELASNRVGISSGKTNLPEASHVCHVLLAVNACARNIISVQGTKLYTQKYVLAWETVPMGNEC